MSVLDLLVVLASVAPQGSLASLQQGCESGKADACFNLAFMHETGSADTVGCDGGVVAGPDCDRPGLLYQTGGTATPRDLTAAAGLYRRSCEGGVPQGLNVGVLYDRGAGVLRDRALAVEFFKKACEGGVAAGCANLGVMYERGEGVPKDLSRAAELLEKGCKGGASNGCAGLVRLRKQEKP